MKNLGSIRGACGNRIGGSDPCPDQNPALLTNPWSESCFGKVIVPHEAPWCGEVHRFLSATYSKYEHYEHGEGMAFKAAGAVKWAVWKILRLCINSAAGDSQSYL
jgi:hypothetical protein